MNPGLWSVIRIDISYTSQGFVNKDWHWHIQGWCLHHLKPRSYIHQSPSVGFVFLLVLAQWNQTFPVTRGVLFPQPMALGQEDPRLHFNQRRIARQPPNKRRPRAAGTALFLFFWWIFFGKAGRFWRDNQHKTVSWFSSSGLDSCSGNSHSEITAIFKEHALLLCMIQSSPPSKLNKESLKSTKWGYQLGLGCPRSPECQWKLEGLITVVTMSLDRASHRNKIRYYTFCLLFWKKYMYIYICWEMCVWLLQISSSLS